MCQSKDDTDKDVTTDTAETLPEEPVVEPAAAEKPADTETLPEEPVVEPAAELESSGSGCGE